MLGKEYILFDHILKKNFEELVLRIEGGKLPNEYYFPVRAVPGIVFVVYWAKGRKNNPYVLMYNKVKSDFSFTVSAADFLPVCDKLEDIQDEVKTEHINMLGGCEKRFSNDDIILLRKAADEYDRIAEAEKIIVERIKLQKVENATDKARGIAEPLGEIPKPSDVEMSRVENDGLDDNDREKP